MSLDTTNERCSSTKRHLDGGHNPHIHVCIYVNINIYPPPGLVYIHACIYIYTYINKYIYAELSASGLLNWIRFDLKSEGKRSEAKRKAKRSESEVNTTETGAESKTIAQRIID